MPLQRSALAPWPAAGVAAARPRRFDTGPDKRLHGIADRRKLQPAAQRRPKEALVTNTYAVGQSWSYAAKPGFEGSRIVIGAINDNADVDQVICVTLVDVPLIHDKGQPPKPSTIDFVPFARAAIDASVVGSPSAGEVSPIFAELHEEWKEETSGDDYLTIPVTVFLDILEAAES
jgi:hypothetical protein